MSLAVRIQHHPSRAERIAPLLHTLAGFDDVAVITDPLPDGRIDTWRVHRLCLEALPAAATHLLVLQDDALPNPDFQHRVNQAIDEHPDAILCAFVPGFPRERRLLAEAQRAGARTCPLIVGSYVPLVAAVYPRATVDAILAWADARERRLQGADDGLVAQFCRLRRIRPLALVPCAVEHDAAIESVGKRMRTGTHRRAALL